MTAEIIDQANELAEQRLQLTIQAHRLNPTLYQQSTVLSAAILSTRDDALPWLAARRAPVVRKKSNLGISRGGCDV